jgi:hypothetical protein
MSNYNYAPGAIHLDHHKDLNIDVKSVDDAIRLMSTFMSDRAEDVTPEYSSSPASDNRPKNDFSSVRPESNSDIPLFKYIHIAVTDEKEREQIHKMIHNIVHLPKMQQVCEELYKMMKDRKVLCTINPDSMLAELRRMGLPNGDINGFSDKNFAHYYRVPKIA